MFFNLTTLNLLKYLSEVCSIMSPDEQDVMTLECEGSDFVCTRAKGSLAKAWTSRALEQRARGENFLLSAMEGQQVSVAQACHSQRAESTEPKRV